MALRCRRELTRVAGALAVRWCLCVAGAGVLGGCGSDELLARVGAAGAPGVGATAGAGGLGGSSPETLYTPTGAILLEPELAVEFVRRSADFWRPARDDVHGGFHTFVERNGAPSTSRTDKSFVGQSRDAYGFVRAFMLTGDESYLELARHALDFLYAHGWDAAHDGWYFWAAADGTPRSLTEEKWSFVQHYALLGITAMCEATREPVDCEFMERGLASLDAHLWDEAAGGYFNHASYDWSRRWGKGFTPTADAITTHALLVWLVTGEPAHKVRLLALADDLTDKIVASMAHPAWRFGIAEEFDDDWAVLTDEAYGFVGHAYKTVWCLLRAYVVSGDRRYHAAATRLFEHLYADGGFDHQVGAPNYDFLWTSGVTGFDKEYWQVEQGVTSGLLGYHASRDEHERARYLEVADRSLEFMMTRLVDPVYGELYSRTDATGTVIDPTKGGEWKAAYHGIETGYYAYLYGNLMVQHRPATLHYRVAPATMARSLCLTPVAVEDQLLRIIDLTLEGGGAVAFDGDRRTVEIPAGVGGTLRVTFAAP